MASRWPRIKKYVSLLLKNVTTTLSQSYYHSKSQKLLRLSIIFSFANLGLQMLNKRFITE
jgi:hypothetical protein